MCGISSFITITYIGPDGEMLPFQMRISISSWLHHSVLYTSSSSSSRSGTTITAVDPICKAGNPTNKQKKKCRKDLWQTEKYWAYNYIISSAAMALCAVRTCLTFVKPMRFSHMLCCTNNNRKKNRTNKNCMTLSISLAVWQLSSFINYIMFNVLRSLHKRHARTHHTSFCSDR